MTEQERDIIRRLRPIPATAWTVGQFVTTGDAVGAYWNGTKWTEGHAP
jgi:hypothetical protein